MATNGMTKRHPFENQHRSSFTLLACPVTMERSFHLSFRTPQHKGHPHPVLSRSTPEDFYLALSPKIIPANRVRNATAPALSYSLSKSPLGANEELAAVFCHAASVRRRFVSVNSAFIRGW